MHTHVGGAQSGVSLLGIIQEHRKILFSEIRINRNNHSKHVFRGYRKLPNNSHFLLREFLLMAVYCICTVRMHTYVRMYIIAQCIYVHTVHIHH